MDLAAIASQTSDLDRFVNLVAHCGLWKTVFSGRGTEVSKVVEHRSYTEAVACIKKMRLAVQKGEIHYGYLKQLTKKTSKDDIINILLLKSDITGEQLSRNWDDIVEDFQSELNNISCSISVLNAIQRQMSKKEIPSDIQVLLDELEEFKQNIERGNVTAIQLKETLTENVHFPDLWKKCSFLQHYIKSKIFWNSCKKFGNWREIHREKLNKQTAIDDDRESEAAKACELAENESYCRDASGISYPETFHLLHIFTTDGINEYKNAWHSLIHDHDQDVTFALTLLEGSSVGHEIKYAEVIRCEPIPTDVKSTLRLLEELHSYEYTVDAVRKSLEAFNVTLNDDDSLSKAINAFDKIRKSASGCCPFSLVITSLKSVESMTKTLSFESVEILHALSESLSLVDFLKEIVEEDIRNLIDAVEDISEQYVQESTVSALIEVKSFLQVILNRSVKEGLQTSEFIAHVNEQTEQLSTNASKLLPAKIHECMSSLHNLKSLYGNVANRGEVTAEIIGNIISVGVFKFQLNTYGLCDFSAVYRTGSRDESQNKQVLIDLRSRALLLMNTRSKSHDRKIKSEDLEAFVSYIDLCNEIADLCEELHQSGNMKFLSYTAESECKGLALLRETLQETTIQWTTSLNGLREKYYLLNFIHGPEIHILYNFFEGNIGFENAVTIIRFIHPDMDLGSLIGEYRRWKDAKTIMTNEMVLECLGNTLHFGYKGKKPTQRQFQQSMPSKKVTDVVQNRKVFVAALDESSNQVVKTLLSLYNNTTQILPEPYQVLICTHETTWNELELLLNRCFGAYRFTEIQQLFCISNIELLTNELQFRLVEELKNINTPDNYLLSLICRGSSKHPFLDELSSYTSTSVTTLSDEAIRQAFRSECPEVVTYTSESPGIGKSLHIKTNAFLSRKQVSKIHISGPLHKKKLIERLADSKLHKHQAIHIDIGSVDDPVELDTFIFELIILRYVKAGFRAACLETKFVYIEIANTINDSLRNSLNTVMSFKREHLVWDSYDDFVVSTEINSPVQVVCQYLQCLKKGQLDKKDIVFSGKNCEAPLEPYICRSLLKEFIPDDISTSFSTVNIFLHSLADQLKKMACSSYFKVSRISEMVGHKSIPIVRSTLVEALLGASKEFASKSIKTCRTSQASTIEAGEDVQELSDILKQRAEGMIRWEDSNHLIFVFHSQNIQTLSPLYREIRIVPSHIKSLFESQMKRALQDFKQMNQMELQSMLQKVARANPLPLSADILDALNSEYALTPDNLLKMVLIMLRVKSHIPVIVMGETGCGKTSLIRYLATVSGVDFEVLPVHSGIEEEVISDAIIQNNRKALKSPKTEFWLFLDEINTSEHIGLMNDAISSRSSLGKDLAPNLIVMGACNPYKLRSESAITTAGLKGKVKTDELSKLVYRVLPLPERMVDYVWDFGSLSDADEVVYIRRMIDGVFKADILLELLQDVLSMSQKFVRKKEDASYSVSLRDVQRCKTLVKWFLEILSRREDLSKSAVEERAIILALAICYHSRFAATELREAYRKELGCVFSRHRLERYSADHLLRVIVEEQRDILNKMELPAGTAKNSSLQENIFVILNCLLNRIPVFLVGKPGCSKSLSMQIIRSNLRGKDSKDRFFKILPQLYCVSFQGSESSTSDGIIKVFEKAIRYQQSNNDDDVLSVVILDEIGLAEISRFNPLKVLHSLLEPDGRPQPDVAVVGISNWSLDASKMNRGIHLSRPDMDENELYQTGVSISESFLETKFQNRPGLFSTRQFSLSSEALTDVLKDIAKSYLQYTEKLRFKNFHGLRDYYSLAKFVSKQICEADEINDTVLEKDKQKIVFEGLQRNFGGLPTESATLLKMFQIRVHDETFEKTDVLKLMRDNISDRLARHLMCITSGESAMSLIENLLIDMGREERIVIFGSHFEEDQTADYNYRILSRIILCMEQGYVLILRDLENVYGSLYDMLNQNYTIIGKKKHCRVALGHYSNPICHVSEDFRCIVLVDENKVDKSDPPFLNRFEKQYLKFTDVVSSTEGIFVSELEKWVDQFCAIEGCHFSASDCFPIYSKDLIPSLVLQIFQAGKENESLETDQILAMCKTKLLHIVQPDAVFRLVKSTSRNIIGEAGQLRKEMLGFPVHLGIWNFIDFQTKELNGNSKGLMTVILTNSSIHVRNAKKELEYLVQVEKLSAFKSEKQLFVRIQYFWIESEAAILFLHCSVAEDGKHIPLAKTTVENLRLAALKENPELTKRAYLILHLDRRTEAKAVPPINFLSGWEIVTLDSIEEPTIPLYELCRLSLYSAVSKKRPLTKYIIEQLFWSFTRIKYQGHGRDIESILRAIEQIKMSKEILAVLEEIICEWIDLEGDSVHCFDWLEQTAINAKALNENSTFMQALEQKITSVINIPLCKLMFQLENFNALSTYFSDDKYKSQRRCVWKEMIHDESIFTINNIPNDSGPECYVCSAADLSLKMPISKIIFERIEDTKDEFIDSLMFVKGNMDLEDEDSIPHEVMEELYSQHESLILDTLPDIGKYMYESICKDYFHDFSNFISHTARSVIPEKSRIEIMCWILSKQIHLQTESPVEMFVKLHATSWIFSSVIDAEYQLFLLCAEVFKDENFFELIEKRVSKNTQVHSDGQLDCDDERQSLHTNVDEFSLSQNVSSIDDGNVQLSQLKDVCIDAQLNENAPEKSDNQSVGSSSSVIGLHDVSHRIDEEGLSTEKHFQESIDDQALERTGQDSGDEINAPRITTVCTSFSNASLTDTVVTATFSELKEENRLAELNSNEQIIDPLENVSSRVSRIPNSCSNIKEELQSISTTLLAEDGPIVASPVDDEQVADEKCTTVVSTTDTDICVNVQFSGLKKDDKLAELSLSEQTVYQLKYISSGYRGYDDRETLGSTDTTNFYTEEPANVSVSGDNGNLEAELLLRISNEKRLTEIPESSFDDEQSAACGQRYDSVDFINAMGETSTNASENFVEVISQKLLPTSTCLNLFETFEDWNNRVSAILTLALQISSEPRSFHSLRFCQDLVCISNIKLENEKCHDIFRLASILQSKTNRTLDSVECFDCVKEIAFAEPRLPATEAHAVIAAYMNRCLEADETSIVMTYFLNMLEEQYIRDEDMIVFKPPMHTALLLEKVEPNTDIFFRLVCASATNSGETGIDLTENPFLAALDETLKSLEGSSVCSSQFAILVIDILESFFIELFSEYEIHETEKEIHSLLSAHRLIVSEVRGLCFLNAVAYFKAFIGTFARYSFEDVLEYPTLIEAVQAVVNESTYNPMICVSLKGYLFKEMGRGMLPWKFNKLCEKMGKSLEVFRTIKWTEFFYTKCLEGNPLLFYVRSDYNLIEDAFSETEISTQESLLQKILKNSHDETVLLSLHAAILGWFYIARCYKQQDDSYNQLALRIGNLAREQGMDEFNLKYLSRLLGTQVFSEFSNLDLKESSSEIHSVIAIFCSSLISLLLSSNQQTTCKKLSFLAKCLMIPTKVKPSVLMSLSKLLNMKRDKLASDDRFRSCTCGYRVLCTNASHENRFKCPVCEKEIEQDMSPDDAKQSVNINESIPTSCLPLRPLTVKLINLFVDGCFRGSVALNFSTLKDVESVLEFSEIDDIPGTLNERIETCFQDLMTMLDMNHRDTYLFLQGCLYQLKDFVCEEKMSCDTETDFFQWGYEFEQKILHLTLNRHETVLCTVRKYVDITKSPVDAIELSVGEYDAISEDKYKMCPLLFRLQGQPSQLSLEHEVGILGGISRHPYPFLAGVLKYLPELELIEHIFPLIQWHLTTVTHTGYRMKKHECLEMTVKEFINCNESAQVRELLGKKFKRFQEALSCLIESKVLLKTSIKRVNNLSKMKECLILNNESHIYKLVKELASIQNNFLDSSLQIAVENNCQALKCLYKACGTMAIPCKSVWDVTKSAIVNYHWDDSLLQFSQADLKYSFGLHLRYEFEAIEKSLALDLVVNKCHLLLSDASLPGVVFVDEFYKGYAKMAKEICIVIPQKPLPSEMIRKVKKKGDEHSGLTAELMTHVGILTALAKKTKGDPEQPIIEFAEMWKNVLTRNFPLELLPAPENGLKLCHLVALYGLLEELNAEPIESISDKYREPLKRDIETDLNNIIKTNKNIAEMILKATKRFSYRCLYAGDVDCVRPLTDYLEDDSFWPLDQSGSLGLPKLENDVTVLEVISTDLKVHHVYETITLLEEKLMVRSSFCLWKYKLSLGSTNAITSLAVARCP